MNAYEEAPTQDEAPTPLPVATEDANQRSLSSILQPGDSATVFTGAENATFRVQLIGTIQRNANLVVTVDGAAAATLSFSFRSTIVNGKSITVSNAGRDPQGFSAALISVGLMSLG